MRSVLDHILNKHYAVFLVRKLKRKVLDGADWDGSQSDDVRREIVINFMFTWYKSSFLAGQFEVDL